MRRSLPAYLIVVAITALLSAWPLAAQSPDATSAFVEGLAALEEEDYTQAITSLEQAVKQEPQNEPAWFHLGVACFKDDDLPRALEALRQALKLAPRRAGTRLYIGRIYKQQGAFEEALRIFREEVLRTEGSNKATAQVALGRTCLKAGLYQEATRVLGQALEQEPEYVEALFALGLAETKLTDYEKAIAALQKAKKILEEYSDLSSRLGRLTPEQQREFKATEEKLAQEYGRAQNFVRDLGLWPALNKARGEAYLADKQYVMARNSYRGALDRNQGGDPTDAGVHACLARCYLADAQQIFSQQGLLFTAISVIHSGEKAVDKGLELDPKSAAAYEIQGEIYTFQASTYDSDPDRNIVSHTYEEASEAFSKALEFKPDYVEAMVGMARTYLKQAQQQEPGSEEARSSLQEARGLVQQALTLQPDTAENYALLAEIAIAEEQYPQAREYAEKALTLDSNCVSALNAVGMSYYLANELGRAARYFRRALELSSRDPQVRFNLGNTFFQMQSWYLARREYRKALEYTPTAALAKTAYQRAYILYQIALTYHETQRYDAEIETLNDSLALDSGYFQAYLQLARAYAAKGEYRGAQRALEQAEQRAETDQATSLVNTLSGYIYETAGDVHAAVIAYSNALEMDSSNPVAKQALVRLSGQQG